MESKPRKVLSDNSHINRELTHAVREAMHRPDEELIHRLNDIQLREQCRDIQEKDRELIQLCDAAARKTIIQDSASQRQYECGNAIDYDDIVASVQKPDALSPFIQNNPRYSHTAWRKRLLVFPDTKAIGRWWRLKLYLYLLGLKNRTPEKFENDMSDVYYAHLASYVGAIVTHDVRLADMIAALFKHVDVLENL